MQFPFHLSYDVGGCQYPDDCGEVPLPTEQEERLARCNLIKSVERGGNNPHEFECCPKKKIVGTGCMNPICQPKDCHGQVECAIGGEQIEDFTVAAGSCSRPDKSCCSQSVENFDVVGFFRGRDLSFWFATLVIAYLVYHFLKCNSKK